MSLTDSITEFSVSNVHLNDYLCVSDKKSFFNLLEAECDLIGK